MGILDGNVDTRWFTEPVTNVSAADNSGNLGLRLAAMLGNMGAGMLKGTNQEWLAAPGAAAGQMASNQLSGDRYEALIRALERSAARTSADKNTPSLSGTSMNVKLSPDGGYITGANMAHKYDTSTETLSVPPGAEPIKSAIGDELNSQLPQALASPSTLNFPQALLRVR